MKIIKDKSEGLHLELGSVLDIFDDYAIVILDAKGNWNLLFLNTMTIDSSIGPQEDIYELERVIQKEYPDAHVVEAELHIK